MTSLIIETKVTSYYRLERTVSKKPRLSGITKYVVHKTILTF